MSKYNELPMRELDLTKFHFDPKTATMSAEVSDLGISPNEDFIKPIYNDACDVGIAVRSDLTGRVEKFSFIDMDSDGEDVHGWWFAPVNPQCRVKRVLIIND